MALSFYKGQIPSRVKGQTTCFHHKGRQLDLYCEECHELACTKCLSSVHQSHTMCDLSEITSIKKQDIKSFINKTEKVDLVQIDKSIASTDTQLKDNVSTFEKLSKQLKKQTKKLIQDLNQLSAQTLTLYQQLEEDNTKLLQTYKQDLEMYSTRLKQQVQECKIVLQRGRDIQIYDAAREILSPVILPVKPTIVTASFNPNKNPLSHLEQAFGDVNISGQDERKASQRHDTMSGNGQSLDCNVSRSNEWMTRKGAKPKYHLLPKTKVLEEWKSPFYIDSACSTTDGQMWAVLSDRTIASLGLLDKKGHIIQKIQLDTRITGISLSPTAATPWVCDKKNNVTELVSERLEQRFSTTETPLCICVTASNHVIVGMARRISKFTTRGKLVLNSSTAATGKPLVCSPHGISECPVTHNVAVAYPDSREHVSGKGKSHVVVMDTDFKELFVYGDESPQFNPHSVAYDSGGSLVIADLNNNAVLLISGRGEFLRTIHTGDYCAYAACVDKKDVLWAVFGGFYVKLLQYLH